MKKNKVIYKRILNEIFIYNLFLNFIEFYKDFKNNKNLNVVLQLNIYFV